MSWKELLPPAGPRNYGIRHASPVMVSVGRPGRGDNYRLIVQTYPTKLPPEERKLLPWWYDGVKVSVRQGLDEDAGQIEIIDDQSGYFELERIGSHPRCPIGIRLPLPAHLPKAVRERQAAEYQLFPNKLLVYLPKWAVPNDAPMQPGLLDLISETNRS